MQEDNRTLYEKNVQDRSRLRYFVGLLVRWKQNFKYARARRIARKRGAQIGEGVIMPIALAKQLNRNISIGSHTSIQTCQIDTRSPIRIGNHVIIGSGVNIITTSHDIDSADWEHKNYGIVIANIFDIRILALTLGYTGNLTGLKETYLGISSEGSGSKKRNQTANWLKRPLPQPQIEYALEDVRYLLTLKDVLVSLVRDAGLEKKAEGEMRKALRVKEPVPGWKKVGDWRRMSKREKVYVKNVFIARDKIARRFNVPAAHVMEKRFIPAIASSPPESIERLSAMLRGQNPRFIKLLVPSLWQALKQSEDECSRI